MKRWTAFGLGLLFTASGARGQSLEPASPVMDTLEQTVDADAPLRRLSGLGPISTSYALELLDATGDRGRWLADDLGRPTLESGPLRLFLSGRLRYLWLESQPIPMLDVQVVENPLHWRNAGLFDDDGHLGLVGARIAGTLTPYFSFESEPALRLSSQDSPVADHASLYLGTSLAALHFGNLAVEGGLGTTTWGHGRIGHLLFSGDHEPFLMARIRSDLPAVPPGFLKFMGPTRFEAFFGRLDGEREFPNAKLIGIYLTFAPTDRLEFGLGESLMYGGSGAPTNNPLVFFSEAFVDQPNPTNRNFLFSFRWRIPAIEIEPYAEFMMEDCCDTWFLNSRDVLNLIGLHLPRIDPSGKADLTLEWVRTNQITYRHRTYTSGYVYEGRILGHPLGPDATGIYARLRYLHSERFRFRTTAAYESRGRLGRAIKDEDIRISVPTYGQPEERLRWSSDFTFRLPRGFELTPSFGIERVTHEAYRTGQNAWNGLASLQLEWKVP